MTWDEYFLEICNVVGGRSKCMSRKIGAVLVRDNCIICTGYNGPPPGGFSIAMNERIMIRLPARELVMDRTLQSVHAVFSAIKAAKDSIFVLRPMQNVIVWFRRQGLASRPKGPSFT